MLNKRGFTLTELLVVMVIIGLLATIIIPVYIARMEDAKVRLARAECRELAQAEEQCAIIHGFYVPLQVLDDSPMDPRNAGQEGDIIDNENGAIFAINPLIRPDVQRNNGQPTFAQGLSGSNNRVRNMIEHWQGPFLTFQRVYDVPGGTTDPKPGDPLWNTSQQSRFDFPLDPWSEPYRFYSPLGVIGTSSLNTSPGSGGYNTIQYFDGLLTTNGNRRLPRYAVVSFGRDSLPDVDAGGNLSTNNDDVVYQFGTPGVESDFGLRF